MSKKSTVSPESLPYRPCVGVMVLNKAGKVWAGRRIPEEDGEMAGTDRLWQMPQGGIDAGEDPLPAALREVYEETGMKSLDLMAEAPHWINYDLPPHLVGVAFKGRFRGQTQRWFAFRFTGDESEIQVNPPPGGHTPEFDAWAWKDMAELPDLIVPFKRSVYLQVVEVFRTLANQPAG
ncbi:RNA pyrophosphohydrolase [Tianweitania sediminis]|jgi:putative (di)nucleoside polyphosphate hydrolase|uniref:RNA pyrophosphohydrolase n=1 Tax=Tianweitania sediminis TaxID=1502156 RepID=A0A8J7R0I1_9HYPH|nr:RNA pyrophosphohydrolase [Tianweitania sediminis]MBP0437746.1 RNA pyrophosphohydrolase [Tianweitania sediminis]HEV7418006.1 RNA pyrophosphohydrolase [Tianweitania sediminis]